MTDSNKPPFSEKEAVTYVLNAIGADAPGSTEELLPLVYQELRKLAQGRLNHEPDGQTLQATALVHEAYVRLVDADMQSWDNRGHFFGAAAQAMRRIMIDRARMKQAEKRGAGCEHVDIDEIDVAMGMKDNELLRVDEALEKLEQISEPAAKLIQLRFFTGLSHPEAAEVLGMSERTAKRLWSWARTWLFKEMKTDFNDG